jgi:hypothetical protein
MKRAESKLIEVFLRQVRKGHIVGADDPSAVYKQGEVILQKMVKALQAILAGTAADKALKIKTKRGKPPNEKNILMAYFIHQRKNAGDSWPLIETQLKVLFPGEDWGKDNIDRLKKIRKRNLWWLSRQDMFERLRQITKSKEGT